MQKIKDIGTLCRVIKQNRYESVECSFFFTKQVVSYGRKVSCPNSPLKQTFICYYLSPLLLKNIKNRGPML